LRVQDNIPGADHSANHHELLPTRIEQFGQGNTLVYNYEVCIKVQSRLDALDSISSNAFAPARAGRGKQPAVFDYLCAPAQIVSDSRRPDDDHRFLLYYSSVSVSQPVNVNFVGNCSAAAVQST
jgi:hypothetical protein